MRAVVFIISILLSWVVVGHGINETMHENHVLSVSVVNTTSPSYKGISPSIEVSLVDTNLSHPARLKISPDGKYMFVAELAGKVMLYTRSGIGWQRQSEPFYDLGDLHVRGERGLTGLFFGADFSPDAQDSVLKDIFLAYQIHARDQHLNRIMRLTFTSVDGNYVGTNSEMIYEIPSGYLSNDYDHQIDDGIGFTYEGLPHILVSIGDSLQGELASNPSYEGKGKLLLMRRDGSDPIGQRPFPSYPKVQAVGLRNTYGILMLPESIDQRRRVLGVENGFDDDRIWFLEAVDFGHEMDANLSIGWTGEDAANSSWTSVLDANYPGPSKPQSVLAIMKPAVSPTSVSLHPTFKTNQAVFVVSYFGTTYGNDRGKQIALGTISNLTGQPALDLNIIIERDKNINHGVGLAAMDVDPLTGDIYFADIVTGELDRAVIHESVYGVSSIPITANLVSEESNTFGARKSNINNLHAVLVFVALAGIFFVLFRVFREY